MMRFVLGFVLFFTYFSILPTPSSAQDIFMPQPGDHIVGEPDAPLTLIEYASLSCHHCADFHNTVLPAVKKEFIDTGKLRFIYRHFPLNLQALHAAMLVNCLPEDQQFKFLSVLFRTQESWAYNKNYIELLSNIAKLGGANASLVDACFQDKAIEERIFQTQLDAKQQLDIQSTPSFYLNGKHLKNRSKEDFIRILREKVASIAD